VANHGNFLPPGPGGDYKLPSEFSLQDWQPGDNLVSTMKTPIPSIFAILSLCTLPLMAADLSSPAPPGWHAQTLLQAISYVLIFAAIGIVAAILGFKLFDKCTPGHLEKEIIENRNVAAAIIAAAVIIGVSIIIAASMMG
jgi:hypothetical protein